MRAAVVEHVGGLPSLTDAPEPSPGEGQALVDVRAAPLNPLDISIAAGRFYAGPPQAPYVPGAEGVGVVADGRALPPGARVWFTTSAGFGGSGALAERTAIDEATAIEVPEALDDVLAACLGVAGLTAWLALEWRAELREGESVLVLGASGAVGQIAVQAARLLGAGHVVAAARDPEALGRAAELGADATVDLSGAPDPDRIAERIRAVAGGPIDVAVDPLWGEPATAASLALGAGGRLVHLGQSASPEATFSSGAIRGKMLEVRGLALAAAPVDAKRRAYARMAEHAARGELEVAAEALPLDAVTAAWRRQAAFPHRKLVMLP